MAGPDYDSEIKQLTATMHTIEQVLDVPRMEQEIADLGVQVAAPDLWDDQANATKAQADISVLEQAVETYRLDNLAYPRTEDGLDALLQPPPGLARPEGRGRR